MGEDFYPTNPVASAPTALVVDEHEVVRYGCLELLQSHGLGACYQAGSVTQAYRMFVRRRPALIVQAWPLDGRTTLKLIRWVRGHAHACPIIVYSSHDGAFGVMDALRAGAAGFVTKSSPPEILFEGVRRALLGEIYISPDVAQKLALSKSARLSDPIRILSQREKAVFELIVAGIELAQIANRLTLSKKTVSNYLIRIEHKLGVDSVADLVRIDVCRKSRNLRGSAPDHCRDPLTFGYGRENHH